MWDLKRTDVPPVENWIVGTYDGPSPPFPEVSGTYGLYLKGVRPERDNRTRVNRNSRKQMENINSIVTITDSTPDVKWVL